MRRRFLALILLALLGSCAAPPPPPAAEPPERAWDPTGPARGQIVALHGFGDHKGAFAGLGARLAEAGYRVLAYDQPGFGEQPDRLFWPGTEALVGQARAVVTRERARRPDLPLVLLGESMGGAVALLAASGPDAVPVDGLVLVAPAVWGGESLPPLYRAATRALAAVLPWFRLSGRGLPVHPADDPAVTRALARDPLYIGEPRADAVAGLLALMDEAHAAGPKLERRVLVLVPGRDDIVPTRVQLAFAATIAAADCRLLVYPEARHLILRDRGRQRVWQDLLAWLEGGPPPSGLGRPCREDSVTSPLAMAGHLDRGATRGGIGPAPSPTAAGLDRALAPKATTRRPRRRRVPYRPTGR
ncbi:MAG: lysophospholipase [Geminicoccaceae bacterium]|nr:lysophospholipase [Geminicoccaceae bacterium]